ncbi:sensor histidine kinase [Nocardioides lianchengensis]|uniref:Oxygen sensor histidine kinase NreB n=1 Tax=Nocardioides lianchengensis TaxID=1045774 RepID=A0A1G6PZQ4_9ACTN|nr:sensor histidine kinase [Nocardioides lianchengensis]NYG12043.1 signal transduction histidine kinase [Nocardioides lianchengensis]SDC85670.1 Signal transduction histidine kinase [Nocardioides lianchengensis]
MDRQPWRLDPRWHRWFDLLLVGGLLLPVPLLGVAVGPAEAGLSLLQIAPLALRRSRPVAVFTTVAAASVLQAVLIDQPVWGQVAFPVAVYSVARFSRAAPAAAALVVGFCGAVVASYDWLNEFDTTGWQALVSYVFFVAAIVATAWALGTLGRTRAAYVATLVERGEQIRREAEQQVELAAGEERARIAREMHDVVAHGLSVIVVQADGARYAAEHDPTIATRTLETISATGRESLTEMRRMLGLLRAGDTGTRPQPRLDDVAVLVAEAQTAGEQVEATLPEPAVAATVPAGVALTAYRVVQEALTNIRKHAGPGVRARIVVTVGRELEVLVEDDGRGAASDDDGRGLGLVGMRERVDVHDGSLTAGPRPGGGYRVSARLPL